MSLSTAASYRASRPLCTAAASFVSATVSATVFPLVPFCVCVLLFRGCLSRPHIHFLPALMAVEASVDGRAYVGGGRVSEIVSWEDKIIKMEA